MQSGVASCANPRWLQYCGIFKSLKIIYAEGCTEHPSVPFDIRHALYGHVVILVSLDIANRWQGVMNLANVIKVIHKKVVKQLGIEYKILPYIVSEKKFFFASWELIKKETTDLYLYKCMDQMSPSENFLFLQRCITMFHNGMEHLLNAVKEFHWACLLSIMEYFSIDFIHD